jgi:hypothetical protein
MISNMRSDGTGERDQQGGYKKMTFHTSVHFKKRGRYNRPLPR